MNVARFEGAAPSRGPQIVQILICVALGLFLAWTAASAPLPLVVVLLAVAGFFVLFLQRPDLGLLAVLLFRSATDATIPLASDRLGHAGLPGSALLTPNDLLAILLILCGGLFMLSRRVRFMDLPVGRLVVLLLLIGLVGILHAPSRFLAVDRWLAVLSTLVVYALSVALFATPRRVQRVIDVIAWSFVLPAAFGVYQLLHAGRFYSPDVGLSRIPGTFVHPNAFGIYLTIIISVFVCQAIAQSGRRKTIAVLIVAVAAVLLVGTYARASWAGALVVLLTVGVLSRRVLLVGVLAAAVLGMALVPSVGHRLADPFGGSFADRVNIWESTIPQWVDATHDDASLLMTGLNRLSGTGPGSHNFLTYQAIGIAYAAHDDFLLVLFEYGVLGLAVFIGIFVVLARTAYRAWSRAPDRAMAAVALSFFALTLAYPVMSLTDNLFTWTQNQFYFWALAGLTAAIGRMGASAASDDGRPDLRPEPAPRGPAAAAALGAGRVPGYDG